METLLAERDRLLGLFKIRAEQRARVVVVGQPPILIQARPLSVIVAAVAAYPVGRAEMLSAKTIAGDVPSEQLDIALASNFGRGTVLRKARGARRRLARLLRIGRTLAALGGGMRLEEIAAWTALPIYRVGEA